jgi:hypothetical protein
MEKKDGHWMEKAFAKNKGSLRRILGAKKGEKIPAKKLAKAAKKGGKVGKKAVLAETARKINAKK